MESTDYRLVYEQAAEIIRTEPHYVSALSNLSALLFQSMEGINWAGFVRVADVHAFPGHIACDASSRSEIVLPIWNKGRIAGVLDIDSPLPDRFAAEDEEGLSDIVQLIGQEVDFGGLRE